MIVGGMVGALLLAVVGLFLLIVLIFGEDPDPRGLEIEYRTDETVIVYLAPQAGGEERSLFVPDIPPRTTIRSGETCGAAEFVARTEDGRLLARRGPFDDCNLDSGSSKILGNGEYRLRDRSVSLRELRGRVAKDHKLNRGNLSGPPPSC